VGTLRAADEVCHRRRLIGLLHCGEVADPCVCHERLAALVEQIRAALAQTCNVSCLGGSRRSCKGRARVRQARRSLRSVGGAAVGAGVALPCGGDLTLAVAEPHAPAPTAAQQFAVVLATCVARARSWRQRCRVHGGGARPGCVRHARYRLGRREGTCSVDGTAVGAGVALPSADNLALAAAEPRVAAPTAAQQLASALAASVACGWRHCFA